VAEALTFGSLFAGVGGLDLGFERAGMRCLWQVELDDFCQRVLAKHWPNVERFGDVRECGNHNLAAVDVICGGFPCVDISNAGRREGIEGERSGLWSEFARIIRELRPRYVVVENVAALLGRGMGRVLGDLAACGYDAEWEVLPAAAFGAPHIRDRVFLVAYAKQERQHPGSLSPRVFLEGPTCAESGWWGKRYTNSSDGALWRIPEGDFLAVDDGFPTELDKACIAAMGNAVVPAVAQWVGERIVECHLASTQEQD